MRNVYFAARSVGMVKATQKNPDDMALYKAGFNVSVGDLVIVKTGLHAENPLDCTALMIVMKIYDKKPLNRTAQEAICAPAEMKAWVARQNQAAQQAAIAAAMAAHAGELKELRAQKKEYEELGMLEMVSMIDAKIKEIKETIADETGVNLE